jgi:hypothetical protein
MWVWVLEGKAADPAEVGRMLSRWADEFGQTTPGYLGTTAGVTDDGRFLLFARWDSEEAGNELLVRAEMQAWWEEFQRHFDGSVEFAEAADVTMHLAGGSDAAGFVQAIKASGVDRAVIDASDRQFEAVASEFRPDLIGGVRVWTSPDVFVEANYFTSEDAARAGEQKEPPPELVEGLQDFMEMMKDAEFFDFRAPFLHSPA